MPLYLSMLSNYFFQEPKYTGNDYGTKKGWTHEGKLTFNRYMIKVAMDRNKDGEKFDDTFLKSVTRKYCKSKINSTKKEKQKRVVTFSDLTIQQIFSDPAIVNKLKDEEDGEDSVDNDSTTNSNSDDDIDLEEPLTLCF